MAEYIDREKLLERMKYYFEHTGGDAHYTYGVAMREIENAPAEDVVPVREGKWIYDHTYTGKQKEIYYCSRCNHYQYRRKSEQSKKNELHDVLPVLWREDGRRNYKIHETSR